MTSKTLDQQALRSTRRTIAVASVAAAIMLTILAYSAATARDFTTDDIEFFESRVRPILVERCYFCHGDEAEIEGNLRLNSRANLLRGGDSGPAAIEGNAAASLFIEAVSYGGALQMPPDGKLPDAQLKSLEEWVARGLPWPAEEQRADRAESPEGFRLTDEDRAFWSFQPLVADDLPSVTNKQWPRGAVDHFILAKLEADGLQPGVAADRRTLIRRATFDLIGLPPTPEEVEAFVADGSPDAFARVIDRLLASPQYGQRWGRHWLDLVRYTDSFDSRIADGVNPMDCGFAWRYRDWIVQALNEDMPYDEFVRQQIAGDLLPAADGAERNIPGVIATGVLAIGNWGGGDADKEKLLTDVADDQIDVVGRAFLGLTLACARCHDHKFDPISTADYYGLAGIFLSTHILENPGPKTNGPPMLRAPIDSVEDIERRADAEIRIAALKKHLETLDDAAEVPAEREQVQAEIKKLEGNPPPPAGYAHACQEGGCPQSKQEGIHDVAIHIRGRYDRLGAVVPRRFPEVLAGSQQPPITDGSGRLQLAKWITKPDHPLTARVMVNRIWQQHFGEGIVRTPSNFGALGERPTHPELLDWLAAEFIRSGWSIKAMHRMIMLSAAYQQSSQASSDALERDGDNRFFGRMNRRRLDAEQLRDSLLAVTDELDPSAGGVAVRDVESPRRTLYIMTIRSDRSSFRDLFDGADPTAIVDKRNVSTVAPQALFMMNHPFVQNRARRLADRVEAAASEDSDRVDQLYRWLVARPATDAEKTLAVELLAGWRAASATTDVQQVNEAAWRQLCQILLCSNEFVFID